MTRAFNFNAGPATLPEEVLTEIQRDLLDFHGSGISVMEHSHRGPEYSAVHDEAERNVRTLMGIPDSYAVLFLTGGATAQFAMVPMNLLGAGQVADYVNSGTWGRKAITEAKAIGNVHIAADCSTDIPTRVPTADELQLTPGAAYLHLTSNETIAGAQWQSFPQTEAPLIVDMSSDIMSRVVQIESFGLVYACAQKNLGPAGVTLVVIRKDLAERAAQTVPLMFRYQTHIENRSLYNTPPCFAIYTLMLTTRWLLQQGGVVAMERRNRAKAGRVYDAVDASTFYTGTAVRACRSQMNVTFRLSSEALEQQFLREADAAGLKGLKGHRLVGGIRASIYNAFPEAGIDALVSFMQTFAQRNG